MRVAVDIDNTINNISMAIARWLDMKVGRSTLPLLQEHLYIAEAVGWTQEQVKAFFAHYGQRVHADAYLKDEYTAGMLRGLFYRGDDLIILTNRNAERAGYDIELCTAQWLTRQKISEFFSEVHFTPGCKETYARENGLNIDVMVEDNAERAEAFLQAGTPVVLFDHPYNKQLEHKLLYRVSDWWEAYQVLVKLDREKGNI